MINKTSLKHPTVIRNILASVSNVALEGYSVDHVRNRNGAAYLAVRIVNGQLSITDSKGKDYSRTFLG